MYSCSVLVLALAVFGASAQTLISSGCNGGLLGGVTGINGPFLGGVTGINGGLLGGVNGINGGLLGGVNGINNGVSTIGTTVASTPVLENVPFRLPSIIHTPTVQDTCSCTKTVVRPTLRKEVFTIPSVQRFVQTTSTPVIETVPYVSGSSVDVPTVGAVGTVGQTVVPSVGIDSGLIRNGFTGLNTGIISGGLINGVNGCGINGGLSGFGGSF